MKNKSIFRNKSIDKFLNDQILNKKNDPCWKQGSGAMEQVSREKRSRYKVIHPFHISKSFPDIYLYHRPSRGRP